MVFGVDCRFEQNRLSICNKNPYEIRSFQIVHCSSAFSWFISINLNANLCAERNMIIFYNKIAMWWGHQVSVVSDKKWITLAKEQISRKNIHFHGVENMIDFIFFIFQLDLGRSHLSISDPIKRKFYKEFQKNLKNTFTRSQQIRITDVHCVSEL